MEQIERDGVLYAIIHRKDDWNRGLDFITPDDASIQAGTFWYEAGKRCKAHRHLKNERTIDYTQECNIVISGSMAATIYDNNAQEIGTELLRAGDMIVVLTGAHGYEILEDGTRVIECKNGPFVSVGKDKEPI